MTVTMHQGDNLEIMRALAKAKLWFDLVYMDPPFNTGWTFETTDGRFAFEDKWPSRDEYLFELGRRVSLAWELLALHGTLVVHVDPKESHYVKVMCDKLLGPERFANEIIWRYRRWPALTPAFQSVHDVLLVYRKPRAVERWTQLYEPLAPSTVKTWGTKKQTAVVKDGKRVRSSTGSEESKGVAMGDVWEIPIIAPVAKERTGYPTQKPLALLSRLIEAYTKPGDIILDPYAGSGTTLVAAKKLEREAIGIDIGDLAREIAGKRIA